MKKFVFLLSLCAFIAFVSCSKESNEDAYHDYWWKTKEYIDGNYKMYFKFEKDGEISYECSFHSSSGTTCSYDGKSNKTYKDNGDVISLNDFTVTGGKVVFFPDYEEIIFHKATWKKGKPKDRSETITSDLIVDYTIIYYDSPGVESKREEKTCTLYVQTEEPGHEKYIFSK